MRIEDQGANFIALRDYAEYLGFLIDQWKIQESADSHGCECEMKMSCRDTDDKQTPDSELQQIKTAVRELLARFDEPGGCYIYSGIPEVTKLRYLLSPADLRVREFPRAEGCCAQENT